MDLGSVLMQPKTSPVYSSRIKFAPFLPSDHCRPSEGRRIKSEFKSSSESCSYPGLSSEHRRFRNVRSCSSQSVSGPWRKIYAGEGGGRRKRNIVWKASAITNERAVAAEELSVWLEEKDFPQQAVTLKMFGDDGLGLAALRPLKVGKCRGDLIGLTLWLMYERSQGASSLWYPFLKVFPEETLSPLLWTAAEQEELLMGSSALEETRQRVAALEEQYDDLKTCYFDNDPQAFPAEHFSLTAFKRAFSIILSRAFYLPSADIFALVVLKVDRDYNVGEQVFVTYGQERPNSDLLISYGFVVGSNPNNYLDIEVELLAVDKLKVLKQQIIEQAGFDSPQSFPLFEDRFPTQLLTYVRLSRLTDVGLFAKISFDRDIIVDQANEYEILMLLMGDCRVRLQGYSGNTDDEIRIANDKKCSPKEKVAARLRLSEKKILINTMAAMRTRLAPIRGVPVKGGGLKDPSADLLEMFDVAEQVASAPAKFLSNLFKK